MVQASSMAVASWREDDDVNIVFCDKCGYWYMNHQLPAGNGLYLQCWVESAVWICVRRATSVALLEVFLPPDALNVRQCWAISSWQTVLRKQCSGTFILDFQDGEKYTFLIEAIHRITFCYKNRTLYQSGRENWKHNETICYSFNNALINQRETITCVLTIQCGRTECSHDSAGHIEW